jgi:protein-tyrosine phosphatase
VVCTGNMCRSPMVAELLRERFVRYGLADQVEVSSAGIRARDGSPASDLSRILMTERGLSLEQHRARSVDEAMLAAADLVLVMEEAQRSFLFHLSMRHLHKVFLLSELCGENDDVPDPIGGHRADYQQTLRLIERLLDCGMPRLLKQLRLVQKQTTD